MTLKVPLRCKTQSSIRFHSRDWYLYQPIPRDVAWNSAPYANSVDLSLRNYVRFNNLEYAIPDCYMILRKRSPILSNFSTLGRVTYAHRMRAYACFDRITGLANLSRPHCKSRFFALVFYVIVCAVKTLQSNVSMVSSVTRPWTDRHYTQSPGRSTPCHDLLIANSMFQADQFLF